MLSDDDTRLIDVLQIAPRASWTAVGAVLGISAVTAAKRWQRLVDEGLAWVTIGPGMATSHTQCLAYVEITCQPQMRFVVGHAVAQHGPAVTVELTTGNADLLVTVAAVDLPTLSHYVLEHLSHVEGVQRTRVRVVTRLYGEGSPGGCGS
jgi:DNA-binding Lrp family transcriptional regulator